MVGCLRFNGVGIWDLVYWYLVISYWFIGIGIWNFLTGISTALLSIFLSHHYPILLSI